MDAVRGPTPDHCPGFPQGHRMVSRSGGSAVRWVEICRLCGWIDGVALDGWAENFLKEQISNRAQRIAVSIESEPFAFVQPSSGELSIGEVCAQALAAASCTMDREGNFDSVRAKSILTRLTAEVQRFVRLATEEAQ